MPQTAITCGIAVLALAGLPPFAGFWSKDAILAAAHESSIHNPIAMLALILGIAVAGITAFYAARMWMMAFWGEPRSEAAGHAHESSAVMTLPLWLLAIPSLVLGFALHHGIGRILFGGPREDVDWKLAGITSAVALAGIALALRLYWHPRLAADPVEKMPAPLYRTFVNLWGIDNFWNLAGARLTLALGRTVAWFDRNVVDGVMNGIGWLCGRAGSTLRRTATGQAQSYAAVLLAALILVTAMLVLYESQATSAPSSSESAIQRTTRQGGRSTE